MTRAARAKPVVVVDYDTGWPVRYEAEKQLVVGALGDRVLGIEHVGSTAVPGLAAKPVVDMMAGVASREVAGECLPALVGIGFTDVTPCDEHPGWYFCVGKGERPHDVHLHLVEYGGRFWDRHIRFRDYLRVHPATGDEYARLKLALAGRHGRARQAYCDAKTGFIKRVETRALGIEIRELEADDLDAIMQTFARWNKRRTQYEEYVVKQGRGERVVLLAWHHGHVAGYGVYTRDSTYHPFHRQGIAEIVDLNVVNGYQRQGVGTALVYECERIAAGEGRRVIGISVGRSPEYAAANRMYPALGYVPDGRGITDSDNELHLVKELDDWRVRGDRA
jgi:GrpB-like predicted nucleotidyltransferase (UPF0157 family)